MLRIRLGWVGVVTWLGCGIVGMPALAAEATYLVKDGQARGQIVIAENPPRMVTLAAQELQTYIQKISGAVLPIATAARADVPVTVYVGKSARTEELGITDAGLNYGAFRMEVGKDYLVLLGHDSDYAPREPFLRNGSKDEMQRLLPEWDARTGEKWGFPLNNVFKEYQREMKIWEKDERGSLNAVYGFLRMQGVRWYLPGELGEVVPAQRDILLPAGAQTEKPDFALRYLNQMFRHYLHEGSTRDEVLWKLRLGVEQAPGLIGEHEVAVGHGITFVHAREETKSAHPEYYMLVGGKRDTTAFGGGRPCLSSEGLFASNVKYVRAIFDLYDVPMVSIMPQDGYGTLCECDLCAGKDTPERGWGGQISDYVWDYVNRVALEVYKTHPTKKVSCFAYGCYRLPPTKIATLSPNLVVGIAQDRINHAEPEKAFGDLRQAWLQKIPEGNKQLWIYEYYLYGKPPLPTVFMPVVFPHRIARDLRSLKGISLGEVIEVYRNQERGIGELATSHLNVYVTAQLLWNADQDVDALLEEYYRLYYGPAQAEMKAFLEYAEGNFEDFGKKPEKIAMVFTLLENAAKKTSPDSIYGRRIALIAAYIEPMKALAAQLAIGRQEMPTANAVARDGAQVVIDGKLDEEVWQGVSGYELRELQTGRAPTFPTTFKAMWSNDALYLAIECGKLGVTAPVGKGKKDDMKIWNGDCVEFLLETQTHGYYQMVIGSNGAVTDLDRKDGINPLWSSGAEIATATNEHGWTVELRLPLAAANQEEIDPVNGISGRKPSEGYPWFFNVCRQRVAPNGTEYSAFSPTGKADFHDVKKFGALWVR